MNRGLAAERPFCAAFKQLYWLWLVTYGMAQLVFGIEEVDLLKSNRGEDLFEASTNSKRLQLICR
jgi:hypothetical protein